MNRFASIALTRVAGRPGTALAGSSDTVLGCLPNAVARQYPFTARGIDPVARVGHSRVPGQTLCHDDAGHGVAAMEPLERLEGWSGRVPAGGHETLADPRRFDRWVWAGPDG